MTAAQLKTAVDKLASKGECAAMVDLLEWIRSETTPEKIKWYWLNDAKYLLTVDGKDLVLKIEELLAKATSEYNQALRDVLEDIREEAVRSQSRSCNRLEAKIKARLEQNERERKQR